MTVAEPPKTSIPFFADRFRYFILILSLLSLTSISSNMLTFNFAVICMDPPHENDTDQPSEHATYNYSNTQQSMLIWAVGGGSIIATFPFSFLYSKYGARYIFTAAGLLSIVSTLLTPLAAYFGLVWFLVVRFMQGIAYAADFAAIGLLTSRWASLKQHAFYISVLTCYSPLSSTLTNIFSGYICESSLGWPFIYYFHGVAGLVLFACWFKLYNDFPDKNRYVSAIELEKIERNKERQQLELNSYVPYLKIFTNPVVLVIWFNAFAEIASGIFLVTYTPIYLRSVHRFSVETTGVLSSLPPLINMPIRMCFGLVSDKIKWFNERTKINLFNTFSVFGPAVCYLVVAFIPPDQHLLTVSLLVLIHFFYSGFYKCATLTCRQYSSFIVANIQFVKCLTLFVGPGLYALFVHDSTKHEQWRPIFIIISIAQILATILFLAFSTDQPQEFTRLSSEPGRNEQMRQTGQIR